MGRRAFWSILRGFLHPQKASKDEGVVLAARRGDQPETV
jgi:hypothetical protein